MCGADKGPRQALLETRGAQGCRRRIVAAMLPVEKAIEAAHRGQRARGRAPGEPAPVTRRQPGPEIRRAQPEQRAEIGRLAEMLGENWEEAEQVGPIRLDGRRALTLLMLEPVQPGADQIGDLRVRPRK